MELLLDTPYTAGDIYFAVRVAGYLAELVEFITEQRGESYAVGSFFPEKNENS
jgi:hypothetical protein